MDVPDGRISLNMLIRRNLDPTLPASHTVELAFTTIGDPQRTVRDVGLLQFKMTSSLRGTPVAGLPVPVKANLFLIGLSSDSAELLRNWELVTKRNWIDLHFPLRLRTTRNPELSKRQSLANEQVALLRQGQVALLRQGVEPWNAWRLENWKTRPNLSAADLSGANPGHCRALILRPGSFQDRVIVLGYLIGPGPCPGILGFGIGGGGMQR